MMNLSGDILLRAVIAPNTAALSTQWSSMLSKGAAADQGSFSLQQKRCEEDVEDNLHPFPVAHKIDTVEKDCR